MHPHQVDRERVKRLTDLPNVGPSIAKDLGLLGIDCPRQLRGRCPIELYRALCSITGMRQDPCVLDVFMSVTDFVDGGTAQVWWAYTPLRKSRYGVL